MPGDARRTGRPSSSIRRTYSAGSRRTSAVNDKSGARSRFTLVRIVLVVVLCAAGLKLVHVQAFEAEALSKRAEQQRTTTIDLPAHRGAIVDRNGAKLAFSVETRTLTVSLRSMREQWNEIARKHPEQGRNFQTRVAEVARFIAEKVPDKTTEQDLLRRFNKPNSFTYLVDGVMPSVAEEITEKYPEIGVEKRAQREYPGGTLAANVIGYANWRMENPDVFKHNLHGLVGLESTRDKTLAGTPGRRLVDTAQGSNSVVMPGSERELQPATAGSDLELTIDSDVQYYLQRELGEYVRKTHAKGGSAVVMDARTGEVYALANDQTFNPNDSDTLTDDLLSNEAVTTPFEPGSVNKVVTAAAAIEYGVTEPDSVYEVPDHVRVADHTVHDAWSHPTQRFTTTGIFAKSSNVGTLLLADKIGPERYMELVRRFGLGQPTGIGLPGESPGYVPPRDSWSGTTFGNLPIGQGLSMTVVQMTAMFQAIANEGLRVEPRLVRATVKPDGTRVPEPPPDTQQVVGPQTAKTVKDMLRAVTQDSSVGDHNDNGTAPGAALDGYQISGKTGTGQQIDPETKAYSSTLENITFAGILPADNPRFVVGVRLDAPDTDNAGPLFHEVASYLAQRFNLPLSDKPAPVVPLIH
ncbi:peptidoglycan D,D-transpeptidase FtsI family protein [Amycolatopsis cihanbeyliensis]|uniref:Cell division protein FtsI (Penicillin-binding protein 3) n=1 Tax=Amycolatopsis cihanbeyliensis TaxID=1128664 RepID=A0A542CT23_AMYCI|nr:penicillin-binding protein 2 [Amycolatopsis cihanbeyliensis]TQI93988.1 cell division protein FtsI (penicillin-binding protein 3) [Amycolatopsis cihanbeyliensis]